MKLILVPGLVAILAGALAATSPQPRIPVEREFMRDKLALSQGVLEGIVTENYDLVIARATKLSGMTKARDWRVFNNPEYEAQSVAFRRQVDELVRTARAKNLDGATLAYVRVTMSCVDCHKLVRGKVTAEIPDVPETPVRPATAR